MFNVGDEVIATYNSGVVMNAKAVVIKVNMDGRYLLEFVDPGVHQLAYKTFGVTQESGYFLYSSEYLEKVAKNE